MNVLIDGFAMESLTSWIFLTSIKSIPVLALVLLCRLLFARWLTSQSRYGLWFALIACLILPFGIRIDTGSIVDLPFPSNQFRFEKVEAPVIDTPKPLVATANMTTADEIPRFSFPASSAETSASNISMRDWLTAVWLAGVVVLATFTLLNLIRYFRIKADASTVEPTVAQLFLKCKRQLDVPRDVQIRETPHIKSPAIFGWWSPTLLLPLGLSHQLNAAQLRDVFLHELMHVRRHDILVNWLATCVQILHWFNPAIWYALRLMRADMEQACDAGVMRHLSKREQIDYGNTLIRLTDFYPRRLPLVHGAGVVETHSQLKRRIDMISRYDSGKARYSLFAIILLMTITSAAVTQPKTDSERDVKPLSIDVRAGVVSDPQQVAMLLAAAEATKSDSAPTRTALPSAPVAPPSAKPGKNDIPFETLIERVAAKTHKKFVIDPRLKGYAQIVGQKPEDIDYAGLLTILRTYNFAAVEMSGYVNVVPIADVRSLPIPTAIEGKEYPDAQFVSMTIAVKNACSINLLQSLRPMIPAYSHVGVEASSNTLIITDTFGNIKRIEAMIRDMDARSKSNGQCPAPTFTIPAQKSSTKSE